MMAERACRSFFDSKTCVIATKHGKEQAIQPVLSSFGFTWATIPDIDTDSLGTFTREVKRKESMFDTAVLKAKMAFKETNADYAIANEGSFGPHPLIPGLAVDTELIVLVEAEKGTVWSHSIQSDHTNFGSEMVSSQHELFAFAKRHLFPEHGLVVSALSTGVISKWRKPKLEKGIQTSDALIRAYTKLKEKNSFGNVLVETDMRAMMNPTRMKVITELAESFALELKQCCPNCDAPGWKYSEPIPGLPCRVCRTPTEGAKAEQWLCPVCTHKEERPRRDLKLFADPAHCSQCNP